MATIAELEARIEKGDAAIRAREASGTPVPPRWHDEYESPWRELLDTAARELAAPDEAGGRLVQRGLGISAGRWA